MKSYRIVNGRKFMWDGLAHESRGAAEEAASRYKSDGFETELMEEEGEHIVYTRREARTVAVEQPG